MLKGENIICISSIDWDFIWQGHQEIMATLPEAAIGCYLLKIPAFAPLGYGISAVSRTD